jgi:hypothetical protein
MADIATLATSRAAADRLARLIDGYLATQLIFVAAKLRLADALAPAPLTCADLAAAVGAEPGVLRRVLRGLAAEQVLDELPGGRFALTPTGQLLRTDAPGTRHGAALAGGAAGYAAMAGLLAAVRGGGVPFELVHGEPFVSHLDAQPDQRGLFQASMAARATREAAAVVAAYDFGRFSTVVDVGGGAGALLDAVLGAAPEATGLLFDRPEVVDGARPSVGGDFFVEVPAGADIYLLSRVLPEWDDDDAVTILRNCRRAMPEHATLLLVEAVLPERAVDLPSAVRMDLQLLALLGGRERTAAEYTALLDAADLRLTDLVPADAATALHVLEVRPR